MTKVKLTKVQAELLAAYAGLGEFPANSNQRTLDKLRAHQLIRGGPSFVHIEVTAEGFIWLGRQDLIEITHAAEATLIRLDESVMGTRPRNELTFTAADEAALVAHDLIVRGDVTIDDDPTNYLITITDRGRYEARELRGQRKAIALGLTPGDVLTITIPREYSSRPGVYTDMVIDRLDDNGGFVVGPKGYRDTICFGYSAIDVWEIVRTGRGATRCMCPPEVVAGGHWPDCRLEVPDEPGVDVPVYDVQITLQSRTDAGELADHGGPFKFGDKDTRTRAHTADLFTQIADGWADIALANDWLQIRVVVTCMCGCGLEAAVEREAVAEVQPLLAPVRVAGRRARVLRTWINPTTKRRWYEVAFAFGTTCRSVPATDVVPTGEFGWGGMRHPVVIEVHESVDGQLWTHLHTSLASAASYDADDLDYLAEATANQWARVAVGHPVRVSVAGPGGAHGYATAVPTPAAGQRRPALAAA